MSYIILDGIFPGLLSHSVLLYVLRGKMEKGAPLFGKKFRLKANVFRSEFALVPLTMTYFVWKILAKNIIKVSKRRQTTICTVWAWALVCECLGSDLS